MNISDIVIGKKPHKELTEKELQSIRVGLQRDGEVNPHDHAIASSSRNVSNNNDD